MNWLPIETAPRDGTLVWLVSQGDLHIGYYDPPRAWDESDGGQWCLKTAFRNDRIGRAIVSTCHYCKPDEAPTWWLPLPEPPAKASPTMGEG